MFDPTTPEALPQPPRDPFDDTPMVPQDETPTHHVQEPQEPAQAPMEAGNAKITLTYIRQLDDRAQTMLKRLDAFKRELAKVGIVDGDARLPGMRGTLTGALNEADIARMALVELGEYVAHVKETLETL